ncbi:regulator of nonsense transcripts 2-like isoform X2 [Mizuhopecten yessoensis]|uniref:regulator of nonsense transcripts 2-like isoform X2 n=1 Tax=Mizuhopecten yessoensis TaxID=6573 RepID=UPI000B45D60D|nr:regulator of nonsense transcripts 2-like isoform X2 [Mizuhopecten yessoensis]
MSEKEGTEKKEENGSKNSSGARAKQSNDGRPSNKAEDERVTGKGAKSGTPGTPNKGGKNDSRKAGSGGHDHVKESNRNRNNSQYDRSGYRSGDRGSDKGADRGGRNGNKGGGDGGSRDKSGGGSRGSGRGPPGGVKRDREHTPRKTDARDKREDRGEKGDGSESQKKHSSKDTKSAQMNSAADLEAQWLKEEEEKKKKEEEEERIRLEEIRKKEEEEKKCIQDYITESRERTENKKLLRGRNLAAADQRPDESFFTKLDSNLKKNTAFVKKLKNLTESQKESLTKEFNGLNLSKYVGEVAASITEAKLKMSDISCAVHISSIMFQRYYEFPAALLENIQKFLLGKKDDKISNPSKYRVDLRFFAELVSVGLFSKKEGLVVVGKQLEQLVNNDHEEHNNLTILSSFCKHCGDDYMGLIPRKYRLLAEKYSLEIPGSQMLQPEKQKACRNLMKDYFQSLCKHLLRVYKDLKNIERHNRRTLQTKGELSNERRESYESALVTYQKLYTNTAVFSDLLDDDMPDLPEEDLLKDEESGFDVFDPLKNAEFQYVGDSTLFEDEDARAFYESLPDLRAFIPGICYKESEQATVKDETKDVETGLEEDIESLKVEDVEREMETEQQIAEVENKEAEEEAAKVKGQQEEAAVPAVDEDYSALHELDVEEDADTGNLMKVQFDAYLLSLPNCVNKDLLDKGSIEFCMNFNMKSNRKKLVKALFTVHRTRYDLLPFYSRMVATLYPCMPDVANDLVQLLKGDFRWHVRKKDQINIESKLKTVRFIGELVKFKLYPKSEALHCVKSLMFDFSHHNIEMACSLLDTCGRFLYRSQDSHHRTKIYLDVMMRKKTALHLDGRYTTMIENAFYYSNPPDVPQSARKIRPPLHEYIRKLLYKDLSKVTTEKVLRQMRKLNWDNREIGFYATKSLIAVWNVRYNSIHCAANLLAGLAPYHEHVAIQVVDGVLEDIRIGMEINHPKYNQRRVSCAKFLGELYNYRMVESTVIFKTLYSFITFGVSFDDSGESLLDPPQHLFRIRLTCVVLETCGQYFDKGSSKKKLDCFLIYFQRYYWFKRQCSIWTEDRPFPIDVENLMQDTIEAIRPKSQVPQNYEEASKAAEDLENEYKQKLASVLSIIETDEGNSSEADEGVLTTIREIEEIDDFSNSLSNTEDDSEASGEDHSQSQRSYTGSMSNRDQGEEGEGVETSENDDDDMLDSAGEDDEITLLTGGPKFVKCSEDDDFMTAFDKMMIDNIQARNHESLKVPQLDIAVPMHLKDKNKKAACSNFLETQEEPKENKSIDFVLMTRRGNKQQFTNLNVPISAEFAAKYKEREHAEKMEKERMKQVVLGIHERQEEEDYQEMIAALNRPMPLVNANRDRRLRNYQHPKGAPDADLIFGSKKR